MRNNRLLMLPGMIALLHSCNSGEIDTLKPNILFILTDDQHIDQWNFLPEGRNENGSPKNLCPTIDSLAGESVILGGLHCPSPLCVPSRFNYLTGQYASRAKNSWFQDLHKLHGHTFIHQEPKLTPGISTLAKQLKSMGYSTGFVGKNHTVEVPDWHKLAVNADVRSDASVEQLHHNDSLVKNAFYQLGFDFADRIWHTNPMANGPKAISVHNMEWITGGALNFLEESGKNPFYLVYSTTVPHGPRNGWKMDPLATPAGMLEKAPEIGTDRASIALRLKEKGLDQSRGDLLWLDDNIAVIIQKLKEMKVLDNTIIVYVSDHAVESGKTTVYQGGMHTMGFIWGKDFQNGIINNSLISTVDLVPTLMEAAGGNPQDYPYDGISILPVLKGKKEKVRETVYGEMGHSRTVIKGKYKYIALRYSDYTLNMSLSERKAWLEAANKYMISIGRKPFSDNDINGKFGHSGYIPDGWDHEKKPMKKYPAFFDADQLYNLETDPDEQNNLAYNPEYKEIVKEMKAELTVYLNQLPGGFAEFKEDEFNLLPKDSVLNIASRLRKVVFH